METKGTIHRYGLRVFLAKTAFGGTERVHVNGVRAATAVVVGSFLNRNLSRAAATAVGSCDSL